MNDDSETLKLLRAFRATVEPFAKVPPSKDVQELLDRVIDHIEDLESTERMYDEISEAVVGSKMIPPLPIILDWKRKLGIK